jgi:hypothetical protein
MAVTVPVNIKNVAGVSLPVALVGLAGWLAFLGVAYHDDWAKNMFPWVVGVAIILHILWWLGRQ